MKSSCFPSKQSGVGLIEILVTVLVLSIGLLGIAALQAQALKNNQSSLERSNAVMLSYFMLDAMRVNRTAAMDGQYNLGQTCVVVADAGNLISHDQHIWMQSIKNQLGPSACGEITCNTTRCTVRIYWDDSRGSAGSTQQMIETSTRL